MSDSPLSDALAAYAGNRTDENWTAFVAVFRNSIVGAVGSGPVDENGRSRPGFGVGRTTAGDGRPRILTFADPPIYARRFGQVFTVGVPGSVLLEMAAGDPDCAGILVNSALEESSVVITREEAEASLD
ncbi:SseB family protein [Catenuloplanes japonicus]|uniref:SseB family protein n=1 Tax=Catenuloplanes japonicus TaxID=33876 RepID=UPI000526DD8E|nr:SseB family protein [Catenuloplanes japonicus]